MSTSQSAVGATHRLVLADALPGDRVRDAVLVCGFAAFTGLAAQVVIPLPYTPVPLTGQTFAVLLGAAALGWRRALVGMVLYLAVGLTGWVPWFSEGKGGPETVRMPSFGYLLGFIAAAALVGWLAGRGWDRTPPRTVLTMVVGNLVIYAVGVPWLMAAVGVDLGKAIALGVTPFVAGDLLKIVVAAGVLPAAWALVGRRGSPER
jgi:biotin transport system substrate-specific component